MEIPDEVLNCNAETANAELFRAHGIDVDDDNDPLPENVPLDVVDNDNIFGNWGFSGICYRKQLHVNRKANANLPNFAVAPELKLLWLFEQLFPVEYVKGTIIVRVNSQLSKPIEYGEWLRLIGIWLLIATSQGASRQDFWSVDPVDRFSGAPFRLNDLMSQA